jgi:hypothetical protein
MPRLGLGLGLAGCDNSAPQAQVLWTDAVDGQTLTTFTKESPFHLRGGAGISLLNSA